MPTGTNRKDALARGLGWFSVALGTAQVAAPRGVARIVGLKAHEDQRAVMRLMGLREITTGIGILAQSRPTPWLWARVAGDALDLTLLAKADSSERRRVAAAMGAVAGVTLPDVLEAARLSRTNGHVRPTPGVGQKAITINRPRDDVERLAGEHADVFQGLGYELKDAPRDRGTELIVRVDSRVDAIRLADDLRRFKQLAETGEVARSDSSPGGHELKQHLKQQPAQPVEEARA